MNENKKKTRQCLKLFGFFVKNTLQFIIKKLCLKKKLHIFANEHCSDQGEYKIVINTRIILSKYVQS